ncbi:hypothetical protein NHX12_029689 [Muraenolepis orangiensis]|uniref:Uncharacterized protein n=1 Tax=Muraenolepis orangiensis TaxID=630683 RepID=A0A9Q0E8S4_9TELE|nr:hypothetical protein NHX12_029689 [Muraenolepis orangiensis]
MAPARSSEACPDRTPGTPVPQAPCEETPAGAVSTGLPAAGRGKSDQEGRNCPMVPPHGCLFDPQHSRCHRDTRGAFRAVGDGLWAVGPSLSSRCPRPNASPQCKLDLSVDYQRPSKALQEAKLAYGYQSDP